MIQQNDNRDKKHEQWLASRTEEIIEPDMPIVDPHHHLWIREGASYMMPELLADIYSGHNVVATVFTECHAMYRARGPEEMRPVGETEFVTGVAAMSDSGNFGPARVCAAMVGGVDLTLGARVEPVLEAHMAASGGRFRGIRLSSGWDASEKIRNVVPNPEMLRDSTVREGLKVLSRMNLSFDCWVYHPQLNEVAETAALFPDMTIILNHVGSPILGGPYRDKRDEVFSNWKAGIFETAKHDNVVVKLGALPIRMPGGVYDRTIPPGSEEVAAAWRPWIETCIEAFGVKRCMFESNFPVQRRWCSYQVVWNAFKRMTAAASKEEKEALLADTAIRAYRISDLSE
jgi:predicted TIM-barrel fold metal-dependent hydrolase